MADSVQLDHSPIAPSAVLAAIRSRAEREEFNPCALDLRAIRAAGCEPDWIVRGIAARRQITIVSADTGAGKSWLAQSLAVAVCDGAAWLDREVTRGRVLYLDEENPVTIPAARVAALGLTEEGYERLGYFGRCGVTVGDGGSTDAWLDDELANRPRDLLIVDTATAATAIQDLNDNAAVADLYRRLRRLAERNDCSVVLLHHERKRPPDGGSRDPGQAMMGARQWAGQADLHLALTLRKRSSEPSEDGCVTQRTHLRLSFPKQRDGVPPEAQTVAIVSERTSEHGPMVWASVELCEDDPGDTGPSEAERLRIILAAHGELRTADLAARAGYPNAGSGTFKRARLAASDAGMIQQVRHGVWGAVEAPEPR